MLCALKTSFLCTHEQDSIFIVNTEYNQNIYTTSNIYKNMISVHKDSRTRWRMWARVRCCSTSVPPKDSTTTCRCCLTTSTCVPWRWWFMGAWLPYISHTSGTQPKSEKTPLFRQYRLMVNFLLGSVTQPLEFTHLGHWHLMWKSLKYYCSF